MPYWYVWCSTAKCHGFSPVQHSCESARVHNSSVHSLLWHASKPGCGYGLRDYLKSCLEASRLYPLQTKVLRKPQHLASKRACLSNHRFLLNAHCEILTRTTYTTSPASKKRALPRKCKKKSLFEFPETLPTAA